MDLPDLRDAFTFLFKEECRNVSEDLGVLCYARSADKYGFLVDRFHDRDRILYAIWAPFVSINDVAHMSELCEKLLAEVQKTDGNFITVHAEPKWITFQYLMELRE